jgi:hypothetical protein
MTGMSLARAKRVTLAETPAEMGTEVEITSEMPAARGREMEIASETPAGSERESVNNPEREAESLTDHSRDLNQGLLSVFF